MSQASAELALRRQQLVLRSALVREQLAAQSNALLPWLAMGDRARAAFRWVRQHPGVLVSVTVVVVIARPRVVWRWGRRAWVAVRLIRSIQNRLAAWERR